MKSLNVDNESISVHELPSKSCKTIDFDLQSEKELTKTANRKLSPPTGCYDFRCLPSIHRVFTSNERLKYNTMDDVLYAPRRRRSESEVLPEGRKRKRLSFDENVEVLAIPMRNEYSTQVRSRLWSTPTELKNNAYRNMVEFSFEGRNWRNVFEDERMLVLGSTGELVHPCHLISDIPL